MNDLSKFSRSSRANIRAVEVFSESSSKKRRLINFSNSDLNLNLSEIVYIGDMPIDQKFAKRAGVDFIHASYGYGKQVKLKNRIHDLKELNNKIFKNR